MHTTVSIYVLAQLFIIKLIFIHRVPTGSWKCPTCKHKVQFSCVSLCVHIIHCAACEVYVHKFLLLFCLFSPYDNSLHLVPVPTKKAPPPQEVQAPPGKEEYPKIPWLCVVWC